ncbi:thioredoxin y1 chloroplastic [Phtheirospermum japonicum]|uniref:Thioredoxin y1 chloroplastic n=1 Tax=Phtheirospermum japonicum TaxID=374723 RepID=A0A830BSA1_9LAMI|nr:thioredoxin y1 chloroplastic [Phtheirospermum japonicum]
MAISATAAASIVVKTSPSSPSTSSKLAHFSSLHFPADLRISSLRYNCLNSKLRPRALTVVASKKQSFSSFDELLEKSDKPVLVDFYATWCGPCQFMVPVLEQVSGQMIDKIQVVKIDTEKYPAIADKYKIAALPTFILFKDGEPCDRFEGALGAEQLIQRIEASLQVKQ